MLYPPAFLTGFESFVILISILTWAFFIYLLVMSFFTILRKDYVKDTWMCNWGYFASDFAVSRITSYPHALRHIHTYFWQVHLLEIKYKCIQYRKMVFAVLQATKTKT